MSAITTIIVMSKLSDWKMYSQLACSRFSAIVSTTRPSNIWDFLPCSQRNGKSDTVFNPFYLLAILRNDLFIPGITLWFTFNLINNTKVWRAFYVLKFLSLVSKTLGFFRLTHVRYSTVPSTTLSSALKLWFQKKNKRLSFLFFNTKRFWKCYFH